MLASGVRVQVTSVNAPNQSLVGQMIQLPLPIHLPIYFDGRYATRKMLRVGDAVIGVLVPDGQGQYRATELDDLGR